MVGSGCANTTRLAPRKRVNSKLSIVKTEEHNLVAFSDANEKRKCHFYCTFCCRGAGPRLVNFPSHFEEDEERWRRRRQSFCSLIALFSPFSLFRDHGDLGAGLFLEIPVSSPLPDSLGGNVGPTFSTHYPRVLHAPEDSSLSGTVLFTSYAIKIAISLTLLMITWK